MGWAALWATFSKNNLVTVPSSLVGNLTDALKFVHLAVGLVRSASPLPAGAAEQNGVAYSLCGEGKGERFAGG
jgi:hypothetical protein